MTLRNSTLGDERVFANQFKNGWYKFRDALRHEDQLVWDEMWKAIDVHQDAIEAMDGNEFEKQFMGSWWSRSSGRCVFKIDCIKSAS